MNEMSLLEEENFSASNGVFSEENSENNSKENEGITPAKKAVKKKASQGNLQPAKGAKAAVVKTAEQPVKNSPSKKVSEKKVEKAAPEPIGYKKAAAKKQ